MAKKLSNSDFAKKFDEIAHKFDSISNSYTLTRRCMEVLKHIRGRCLEVGAGTGNVIFYIKNKKDYILSDISPKMCRVAKQKHNVNVVCCDAENLSFQDETFDTILSLEVMYYLSNPENFIKEARRILKDRGNIVIVMANQDMKIYDNIRGMLRKLGISRMYFDDGVRSFMKLSDLKRLLTKNGFELKLEKKIVLLPSKTFHSINLLIEKIFLNYFCAFVFVVAEKTGK